MTIDEILGGIDRSLAAIATERERLLRARTQLAPGAPSPTQRSRPAAARRNPGSKPGGTMKRVLESLDVSEPRTAGDIARTTKIQRPLVGTTLSRLVRQGLATKAERGYLRAGA